MTVLLIDVDRNVIYTANVGDTKTTMVKIARQRTYEDPERLNMQFNVISSDHTLEDEKELKRIKYRGGDVRPPR